VSLETESSVNYSAGFTHELLAMSRRVGSVLGGEEVIFTLGSSTERRLLDDELNTASVSIDGRECVVTSASETEITCVTSDKPFVEGDEPSLEISLGTSGKVATKGMVFLYTQKWSDVQTWGGLAPVDGDAIHIPKGMNLLVDIESTPMLSLVNVEGSLIFDPAYARSFNAEFVLVKNGYLEIGTEEAPFCGPESLTITMSGSEFGGSTLPVFGNKVLAVHGGVLEMHGCPRDLAWTMLSETAEAGAT
jgi:hypothetical protein